MAGSLLRAFYGACAHAAHCVHNQVLAATKDKPLVLPTYAAYVHNHIKVRRRAGSCLSCAQMPALALQSLRCHVLAQHGVLTTQPTAPHIDPQCLF